MIMTKPVLIKRLCPTAAVLLTLGIGCRVAEQKSPRDIPAVEQSSVSRLAAGLQLASHAQVNENLQLPEAAAIVESETSWPIASPAAAESIEDLESFAIGNHPTLRRMEQEAAAARAKAGYVGKLPDPTVSAMFFTPPMNLEPDRQVADVQVMQMIPWLSRLGAEEQRAQFEAMIADNEFHAERLRIIGSLRSAWFRLYVLGKQIETAEADKTQLESLIRTANARVAAGNAEPGDVLLATVELAGLQEQLISYRQQIASTTSELNRAAGRESGAAIVPPGEIDAKLPAWNHDMLLGIAMNSQPELTAARLRTAATRWGVEVARLKRRPDVTVSGGWIAMDAPMAMMPGAGADSWTVGVSTSLPIWQRKYDAITTEATREHYAAHASEDEIVLRLDAELRDLWEQARAAQQTVQLYEQTILPQARQSFEAEQKSLANNTVTFDRVIRSYRTLLNLQLGYHRALGQLAAILARIRQTIGVDLDINSSSNADHR
jgi:cobalt-zinc-cadmium efflux system outer membrane protein